MLEKYSALFSNAIIFREKLINFVKLAQNLFDMFEKSN